MIEQQSLEHTARLLGRKEERERIIKLLDGLMDFETDTQRRIDHKLALQVLKDALIKGEK